MVAHKKGELGYNGIIDKSLVSLIKMNIDLKDVLYNSEILMMDIRHESYPALHCLPG